MKITFNKKVTEEVKFIKVYAAVRYGDEDIPFDAPMRNGDTWSALIDVDDKKVVNWPQGKTLDMYMKVCDQGSYILLDKDMHVINSIESDYVPNNLLPGEYGDYLELQINEEGVITNWLPNANFDDFINNEED